MGATLAVITQAWFLQARLTRKHEGLGFAHLGPHALKVLAASALMAAAVAGAWAGWVRAMGRGGWHDLVGLAACIALGVGVFAAAVWALRVEGREELTALIKRKLKRSG